MKADVFLAMPHYSSQVHMRAAMSFFSMASAEGRVLRRQTYGGSLLAKSFNMLWAAALNTEGVRYFVMQHSDVSPEVGFVDKLCRLIAAHRADVLSVVLPIKDQRGLTSTAIDGKDKFHPLKQLSIAEVKALPTVFDSSDAGHAGKTLLVNTGCFIADMQKPWAKDVVFSIDDCIEDEDGVCRVGVAPEDWQFSRFVASRRGKVMATTAIAAEHFGEFSYRV